MCTKQRLNDVGKIQPEFVKKLCEKWKIESSTKETAYIIKKACGRLKSLRINL